MDWLHVSVALAAGLVICAFAYFFEKVNANQPDSLKRIARAASFLTVALLVSTSAAGYWETVDLLGLGGLALLAIAWVVRLDEDYRWISLIFGALALGSWAYFSDATFIQKCVGIGLAAFCCVMMEVIIRTWETDLSHSAHLYAVTN